MAREPAHASSSPADATGWIVRVRRGVAWLLAVLGVACAALSVRGFFVTDRYARWFIADSDVIPQTELNVPQPGWIAFRPEARWHALGLMNGRGRLHVFVRTGTFGSPRGLNSDPQYLFVPSSVVRGYHDRLSPTTPDMSSSALAVADVGVGWRRFPSGTFNGVTQPSTTFIEIGLPLPLLSMLLLAPLAWMLARRLRARRAAGRFEVIVHRDAERE